MSRAKRWVSILSVVTIAALLLIGCTKSSPAPASQPTPAPAPPAKPATTTLIHATYVTPTHPRVVMMQRFNEMVEKFTDGRIKIDFRPGGSMAGGPDQWENTINGISHIGMIALPYVEGKVPILAGFNLPFMVPTELAGIIFEKARSIIGPIYEKENLKFLWGTSAGEYYLATKKPFEMKDLKGMKIRAPGGRLNELVQAWGTIPQNIAQTEAYISVQQGVCDATLNTLASYISWKMNEVSPYVVAVPGFNNGSQHWVMNLDTWKKLSKEDQDAILKVSEWMNDMFATYYDRIELAPSVNDISKLGLKIKTLTPEEVAVLKAPAMNIAQKYVKEVGPVGEQLINLVKSLQE